MQSCDIELEKKVAAAFKSETGESFSTMTERMFGSVDESDSLMESFKIVATKLPFKDFSFKVLEQKTWPIDLLEGSNSAENN